ncbi:MAG: hypothetical protein ABI586_11815 [Candidatus Nanopelagicales bacterium]
MSNSDSTLTRDPRSRRNFKSLRWLSLVIVMASALTCAAAIAANSHPHRVVTGKDKTAAVTGDNLHSSRKLGVRARIVDGPLVPGARRTLRVKLLNHLPHRLTVKNIAVDAKRPPASGCKQRWVKTSSFHASKKHHGLRIRAKGSSIVRLPIRLTNLPNVNQDACKNTRFPLVVSATARQT